jgi:hypothetical protein
LNRTPQPAPGRRTQHFPAFLAGASRPLLPSMIDYSVFSQLAAARGSIISGPVSRSAAVFNFLHLGPNSAYASFGYRQSG